MIPKAICIVCFAIVGAANESFAQLRFLRQPLRRIESAEENAVCWLDYNNDGRLDLYVAGFPGSEGGQLLQQTGTGSFVTVTSRPILKLCRKTVPPSATMTTMAMSTST